MSTDLTSEQWEDIGRRLREPVDPKDVDFLVKGKVNEQTSKGQVIAYIDARAVQDRLDAVVGIGNWSFDWQPLNIDSKGEVTTAKGTLTIYGVAKSDAGTASNFEATLGAVSHCFKRAAVQWGVGRYLYNLSSNWVTVEKNGRIPDATLRELRAKLPQPASALPAARTRTENTRAGAVQEHDERSAPVQPPQDNILDINARPAGSDEQKNLAEQLKTAGYKTTGAADKWLADHVRGEAAPKGALHVVDLVAGTSNINVVELKTALRDLVTVGRAPERQAPARAY